MSDPLRGRIAALRAEGRHADAAKLALDAGDPERAATLFAQVWRWPEAQAAARRAGRLDRAYAYAIAGDDRSMTREVIAALADDPNQARLAAAHAEAKGRARDAAQLFEHALELGEAARLYEAAGELGEAARCQEARGAHREAGRLYERRVREHPSDAAAALSLGRILIRFARYEPAAKALQGAEADPAHAPAALGLLVGVFQAMGMAEAASSCLDRLRLLRPELPIEVPEALRALYGDPRGLLGGEEQAELLGGRYRVCQRLGAGATGRVVLARDVFHERDVAIKILNVSAGSAGRDAYERFAREARIAAAMEHPNLLRVYEYDPSGPYIVMEPMMGGTLEERLEASEAADRRLSLGLIRQVLSALLRGLEAVHRRGVIHRDIKPANIFFDAAGGVKLGDFGVAHLSDLGTTRTGAMMGTLAYMAPEQLTGAGLPSPATDLYALGIVAYRMLAGRLPFPGPDFVTQHLRDAPPPLRALAPGILPALASLVMALLEKEADARPASSAELLERLAAFDWIAAEREWSAAAPTAPERGAPAPSSSPTPPPEAEARYRIECAPIAPGLLRAWDRVIDRQVLLEDCDASRILMLRRFAQADHPFLQAVYALDEAEGRAILESPRGVALSSFEPDDPRRIGALMQARAALRSLHDAELAHGAIEGASILVAEGRAVLLLPRPRDPELRPEPASMLEGARDDLRALERLGWSESASIQPASGAPARLPPGSGPSAREESS